MTREEAARLAPLIAAFVEGKTIQYKSYSAGWIDTKDPQFSARIEYRIKPDPPKVLYVLFGPDDKPYPNWTPQIRTSPPAPLEDMKYKKFVEDLGDGA